MRFSARMNVDFPQPLGPIIAVTALAGMSRLTLSIARFDPYHIETFFASIARGSGSPSPFKNTAAPELRGSTTSGRGIGAAIILRIYADAVRTRVTHLTITLTQKTPVTRTSAPAHAWRCQLSYGEIAYVKICKGSAAIGSLKSWFQKWLPNAVKRRGAVSPPTRARASRMPVMIPRDAVFTTIWRIVFQRAMPRARAASR